VLIPTKRVEVTCSGTVIVTPYITAASRPMVRRYRNL
jgi:hypothetical protein